MLQYTKYILRTDYRMNPYNTNGSRANNYFAATTAVNISNVHIQPQSENQQQHQNQQYSGFGVMFLSILC